MILLIGLAALTSCLIYPWLSRSNQRAELEFNHELRKVQLRWTRRAYPELQQLSYRTIAARYRVTEGYQSIGTHRRSGAKTPDSVLMT